MSIKLVTLYEPRSTDGYRSFGEGCYFKMSSSAEDYSRKKNGAYSASNKEHKSIVDGDNLKSGSPVYVEGTEKADEQKRKLALSKLSEEDKKVLGL